MTNYIIEAEDNNGQWSWMNIADALFNALAEDEERADEMVRELEVAGFTVRAREVREHEIGAAYDVRESRDSVGHAQASVWLGAQQVAHGPAEHDVDGNLVCVWDVGTGDRWDVADA